MDIQGHGYSSERESVYQARINRVQMRKPYSTEAYNIFGGYLLKKGWSKVRSMGKEAQEIKWSG